MHIGSADSKLGFSKKTKARIVRRAIAVAIVIAIFSVGAYSVYHYAGAGVALNQRPAARSTHISDELQPQANQALQALPANNATPSGTSAAASKTESASPVSTTQPSSVVVPGPTTVASTLPTGNTCSKATSQAQIAALETELNTDKQQLNQNPVSGQLNGALTTLQQDQQALQSQINQLTTKIQNLTDQPVTC